VGVKSNRAALGAVVTLIQGGSPVEKEVRSGDGFISQSDLRLHFGLGKAEAADWIEVKWPTTQKIERFTNVPANRFVTIREGEGIVATYIPPAT